MTRGSAAAKINLALVVGPRRDDGYHEVATVLQRIDLADRIELEPAPEPSVTGFAGDTLVSRALDALTGETGTCWRARIEKRIPIAAGLGGGSSDAATALALANESLAEPLGGDRLHELAARPRRVGLREVGGEIKRAADQRAVPGANRADRERCRHV